MNTDRFNKAIARFDEYNANDPNGKEVLYASRMTDRLNKFRPDASEAIQLAVRCQHIGRWTIPRNTYPEGKKGYIAWRNKLKSFHADTAAQILQDVGYDESTISSVKDLLLKKDLRGNTDTKLVEDVVCMVFVEFYLDEFAARHEDDKVTDILGKTLKKMTPSAIQTAATFNLSDRTKELLTRASS